VAIQLVVLQLQNVLKASQKLLAQSDRLPERLPDDPYPQLGQ
jgi:hypothetical protein